MVYGMCVTAYTMPQMAILPAMTLDDEERNDVVAKGAGVCALMFTIASTFSTQLVEIFGSYRNLMVTYAVFAVISFWGLYKTSEERYVMPKEEGEGGMKQLIYVFRHKEIWPVMLVWCLAAVSYGFMFSSSVYYAQYILAGARVDFATMDEGCDRRNYRWNDFYLYGLRIHGRAGFHDGTDADFPEEVQNRLPGNDRFTDPDNYFLCSFVLYRKVKLYVLLYSFLHCDSSRSYGKCFSKCTCK